MILITAQPIHDDGSIGYDNRAPIVCTAPDVHTAMKLAADEIAGERLAGDNFDTYDLTLEFR